MDSNQDLGLTNLANNIGNLHLNTGSNLNVKDVHAAKVDNYQREKQANINFGNNVRDRDAKNMLHDVRHGNLDSIAGLKAAHNAGQISQAELNTRRASLKQGISETKRDIHSHMNYLVLLI